jgi:hypothetical protein
MRIENVGCVIEINQIESLVVLSYEIELILRV